MIEAEFYCKLILTIYYYDERCSLLQLLINMLMERRLMVRGLLLMWKGDELLRVGNHEGLVRLLIELFAYNSLIVYCYNFLLSRWWSRWY